MLFLTTELWRVNGGIQRYGRTLARILSSARDPVTVITYTDGEVNRPPDAREGSIVCCGGSKANFVFRLLHLARKGNGRVLIVGHVAFLPLAWFLKIVGLTKRYILITHGIEAWRRLGWISRMAARSADCIVASTNYTVREFSYKNGIARSRFAVIPLASALPVRDFQRAVPGNILRLLCVSRLVAADRYKGVDTILQAVLMARANGVPVTLDIVGTGDDLPRLKEEAVRMAIGDIVTFHGAVTDSGLEHRFQEADVFVLPSKKEGFGIVYLEAMASGLPCIGANHGGAPEVIDQGETGFLIEYGDARQLEFYLGVLRNSPALYQTMARASFQKASKYTVAAMASSWQSLLNDLEDGTIRNHEEGCESAPC